MQKSPADAKEILIQGIDLTDLLVWLIDSTLKILKFLGKSHDKLTY